MAIDLTAVYRGLTKLNQTNLQQTNPALWELLKAEVDLFSKILKALDAEVIAAEENIGNFKFRSYITVDQESPYLPAARKLVAGSNITLTDDLANNEIEIAASGSSGGSGASTPVPYKELKNELRLPWVPNVPVSSGLVTSVTHPPGIVIGNGSTVITTGIKGIIVLPYAGTIRGVYLISSDPAITTCSIQVDIKKTSFSSFSAGFTSICAAALPTITSAKKYSDTTLTGWTTTFAAFDVFEFEVISVTSALQATLTLDVYGTT